MNSRLYFASLYIIKRSGRTDGFSLLLREWTHMLLLNEKKASKLGAGHNGKRRSLIWSYQFFGLATKWMLCKEFEMIRNDVNAFESKPRGISKSLWLWLDLRTNWRYYIKRGGLKIARGKKAVKIIISFSICGSRSTGENPLWFHFHIFAEINTEWQREKAFCTQPTTVFNKMPSISSICSQLKLINKSAALYSVKPPFMCIEFRQ